MSLRKRVFKSDMKFFGQAALAVMIASAGLTGCQTGTVLNGGYVLDEQSLNLVPEGSSREQVLLSLGTPSTTATFDAEVFYYISQKRERSFAFQKFKVVDQSILAIYFDKDGVVSRRANYTLKDGRVFDTVTRVTPTGGKDLTFLQQLLSGGSAANAAKGLFGAGNQASPQNPASLR